MFFKRNTYEFCIVCMWKNVIIYRGYFIIAQKYWSHVVNKPHKTIVKTKDENKVFRTLMMPARSHVSILSRNVNVGHKSYCGTKTFLKVFLWTSNVLTENLNKGPILQQTIIFIIIINFFGHFCMNEIIWWWVTLITK